MRNATCVETQTSKAPTQVHLLSISYTVVKSENDSLWSCQRVFSRASTIFVILYINDMPESLNHSSPLLYADDSEIYASFNDCADFVDKVNHDLESILKCMEGKKQATNPAQ